MNKALWSREELVLILALFFDPGLGAIEASNPKVIALSELVHFPNVEAQQFDKSPNAIATQLERFQKLHQSKPPGDLTKQEKQLFKYYKHRKATLAKDATRASEYTAHTKSFASISDGTTMDQLCEEKMISKYTWNACRKLGIHSVAQLLGANEIYGPEPVSNVIGARTRHELQQVCDSIRRGSKHQSNDDEHESLVSSLKSLDQEAYLLCKHRFREGLRLLPIRAQNAIARISPALDPLILVNYFLSISYDFTMIPQIGVKTAGQLRPFFDAFRNEVKMISHARAKDTRATLLASELQEISGQPGKRWMSLLRENFAHLETAGFPLTAFLENFIRETAFRNKKHQKIVLEFSGFFGPAPRKLTHVAKAVNLTGERVRQLIINSDLPGTYIRKMEAAITLLIKSGLRCGSEFLVQDDFQLYRNGLQHLNTESELSDQLLARIVEVLNPKYIRVTAAGLPLLMVTTSIARRIRLAELLDRLQSIRKRKTSYDTIVKINECISDFVPRAIDREDPLLHAVIVRIVFEVIGVAPDVNNCWIFPATLPRPQRDYIEHALRDAGRPQHIDELKKALEGAGHSFSRESVRSVLLRYKDVFVLASASTYGLKEWELEGRLLGGTIKQIMERYLLRFEEPRHISELWAFLNQYRPVSQTSLFGNLVQDPGKIFKNFGKGFFGLNKKTYPASNRVINPVSKYWFDHLLQLADGRERIPMAEVMQQLTSRYQVQDVQLTHLLAKRVDRGDIRIEEDWIYLGPHCRNTTPQMDATT
ncbi:MAG: hypothetical protein EOO15_00820 [Chitinophagaceae bacterium]|nr:MAG: hypothetical protein EOO15_00820 [Chitinophagaceae bacterium]